MYRTALILNKGGSGSAPPVSHQGSSDVILESLELVQTLEQLRVVQVRRDSELRFQRKQSELCEGLQLLTKDAFDLRCEIRRDPREVEPRLRLQQIMKAKLPPAAIAVALDKRDHIAWFTGGGVNRSFIHAMTNNFRSNASAWVLSDMLPSVALAFAARSADSQVTLAVSPQCLSSAALGILPALSTRNSISSNYPSVFASVPNLALSSAAFRLTSAPVTMPSSTPRASASIHGHGGRRARTPCIQSQACPGSHTDQLLARIQSQQNPLPLLLQSPDTSPLGLSLTLLNPPPPRNVGKPIALSSVPEMAPQHLPHQPIQRSIAFRTLPQKSSFPFVASTPSGSSKDNNRSSAFAAVGPCLASKGADVGGRASLVCRSGDHVQSGGNGVDLMSRSTHVFQAPNGKRVVYAKESCVTSRDSTPQYTSTQTAAVPAELLASTPGSALDVQQTGHLSAASSQGATGQTLKREADFTAFQEDEDDGDDKLKGVLRGLKRQRTLASKGSNFIQDRSVAKGCTSSATNY